MKNSFLKCLKDLHLFIKAELSKDQSKDISNLSKFGADAHNASIEKSLETEKPEEKSKPQTGMSFGKMPSPSEPEL